jgi:hypothetical protein
MSSLLGCFTRPDLVPHLDQDVESSGRNTSTREPKRIRPSRSPLATFIPSLTQQTILLAINPRSDHHDLAAVIGPDQERVPFIERRGLVQVGRQELSLPVTDGNDLAGQGLRFTWTLKMFMKMLIFRDGCPGCSSLIASSIRITFPSAGR